ncbi:MAG: chemotaxis protein CheW [Actinobacteria bacterium]|nr:chemotaxis protein CheW [Actinomycetota bacterium]MBV9255526.1 chemotaxis protein CheW [Actinomycetota bacterium]
MRSLVRFRTGDGDYAVPVEHTREVRTSSGMVPLPASAAGVAGLLQRDDEPLTVVSTLGPGRDHVLVLDAGTGPFGLLVEEVAGVVNVDDADVGPAPAGQNGGLVTGVVNLAGVMVLLVDPARVGAPLGAS